MNLALVLMALAFICLSCGKDLGVVQGKVRFEGLPCQEGQTDFNVPPCSGPYANYQIKVFKEDNLLTPIFTTESSVDGSFKIVLPVGNYVIRTQNGKDARNDQQNFPFTVEKNKVTPLDLVVNTGIR